MAAILIEDRALWYADGADESHDRPAHVRAGSSLARVPGGIALVQDDANFVAVVEPETGLARAIALPAGQDGRRQFDTGRGNKEHKLDLEACFSAVVNAETVLVAFGSGSTSRREQVVIVSDWAAADPQVRVVPIPEFYALLRDEPAFAAPRLNIEGAVLLGDTLRLFARGNGAALNELIPASATCDVSWSALLDHLNDPAAHDAPAPTNVLRYEIGQLDGVRLGFTDAAVWGDAVLFTAAAEDSVDAVDDGVVTGSVLGVIEADGTTRWTMLVDQQGDPFTGKVEGVLPTEQADQVYVVIDEDDWSAPSRLCTVRLQGSWRDGAPPVQSANM
jgi:hypothetical protein